MPQDQQRQQTAAAAETEAAFDALGQTQTDSQSADQLDALDAVLDDIESTLESNAEEYVSSFVQKGGQ